MKIEPNYAPEKPVRWKGHSNIIKKILKNRSKEYLRNELNKIETCRDFLYMSIRGDTEQYELLFRGELPPNSAMAITTGTSLCAFVEATEKTNLEPGLHFPEELSENDELYKLILDYLKEKGIEFNKQYPFI
jgi:hypothetical protein